MTLNLSKNIEGQRGVALYLALLVLTILFAISLALTTLLVGQIKIIKGLGDSVVAFYAADTGMEMALQELYATGSPPCQAGCSGSIGTLGSVSYFVQGFSASSPDCPGTEFFCIKSGGTYRGIKRSVETSR